MESIQMLPAFYLALPFFLLLILINWLGYRFKNHHIRKFPGTEHIGIGPTEGSLLGLTALLLSFTFGISATKYEARRQLVVREANLINTTIKRCDLYPDDIRKLLRGDLKKYLETRIDYFADGRNEVEIGNSLKQSHAVAKRIWDQVALQSHNLNNRVASFEMVPELSEMIDMIRTREAARRAAVPPVILIVLCALILVSAFLSGYGSKKLERNRVLVVGFAMMTTLSLYLVIDLDRPRQGAVNLKSAEQLILHLRAEFIEGN